LSGSQATDTPCTKEFAHRLAEKTKQLVLAQATGFRSKTSQERLK